MSSSTVSSSLVTTSREGQLKLLVLSYNSDTGNKRRDTLNISGWCLPLYAPCTSGGGGVLMVLMPACAHWLRLSDAFQESELLTSDMKVNRIACMCCSANCFIPCSLLGGAWLSNQQDKHFKKLAHWKCQYFGVSTSSK